MISELEKNVLKMLQNTPYNDEDKFCGLTREELTPVARKLAKLGFIRTVFVDENEESLIHAAIDSKGKKYLNTIQAQ